ncbi:polyprenyl synthetase family protein [Rubrobacter aplysinae]|uniref:polyprenyl synthetase family protein n=1 Tax=Rubrobacter aplysinae TaxID=909625 RepID=UPI001364D80A|nr:polyprenyl synthetase family protein [Rubrobacter aplysinae]
MNSGDRDRGRYESGDGRSVARRAGELKETLPPDAVRLLREVEGSLVEVSRRAPENLVTPTLEALTAGGKRLRPLLLILSSALGGADRDAVLGASTAVEVLHTATLIHDDIVDRAESRRGRATTVATYGREKAVAAGDYLFAEAFSDLAAIGDPRLIRAFAEASEALATGELEQYRSTGSEVEVEVYLNHIRMKTAGLFKAACVAGGSLGGLSLPQVDALSNYGQALGVAFQMSDDVMDFAGVPGVTGKGVGGDLAEGTVTLPVIFALREGDAGLIRRVLAEPEPSPELLEAGIDAVLATDAVSKTEAWARGEVEAALEDLTLLPETEERIILEAIAREVVGRDT